MSNFVISPPYLELNKDLEEKELELRHKRDAVQSQHKILSGCQNKFQKVIICLSLLTALVESVKSQLKLTESPNEAVAHSSSIAPIFLSTVCSIVGALLRFRDFPTKLEANVKAVEKCAYAIARIRELKSQLNFEDEVVVRNSFLDSVCSCHRDALEAVEVTLYPEDRKLLFEKAQANLLQINEDNEKFKQEISGLKLVDIKTAKPKVIYPPV